jgi:hypothetical protein
MVAYSFKARFAAPIQSGVKRQTLRNDRKRHALEGETLQLYTGMRTRSCKLIGLAICLAISRVRLDFVHRRVEFLETGTAYTELENTDQFAVSDGFADWRDMENFWAAEHPDLRQWEGVLIRWTDLRVQQ